MPPERIGPYRLERPLGAGGMGEVFLAYDERLGRRVAIKQVRVEEGAGEAASRRRERFRREARAAAQLNHPAIVQIYDLLQHDGCDYIVMEYVEGRSLRELLDDGSLEPDAVVRLGREVAEALAEAHAKGIVHRDLKTENVLVTGQSHAKVLDFGLAKALGREAGELSLSVDGNVLGTCRAMSPEQASGHEVDHRSDLFSLGTLLYEATTGVSPFEAENPLATVRRVIAHHPESPRVLRPSLPARLAGLILDLLRKDPADRPQSAAEVAVELEAITGELVPERAPSRRTSGTGVALPPTQRTPITGYRVPRVASGDPASRGGPAATAGSAPVLPATARGRLLLLVGGALTLAVGAVYLQQTRVEPRWQAGERRPPALAVLPFRNFSDEPEYFVDGITDALIGSLARLQGVRVISRQSAMRYKGSQKLLPEIARELGVDLLIEGSVQRMGEQVRIAAQLLRAEPEEHLWGKNYERPLQGVASVQHEIAGDIARQMRVSLPEASARTERQHRVDPAVYEEYLKGLYETNKQLSRESLIRAQAHFRLALEMDPGFAPAYAALADIHVLEGHLYAEPAAALAAASVAAMKALELDEQLAAAHTSAGYVAQFGHWDWETAEREYRRAIALDPNSAQARRRYWALLSMQGRFYDAEQEILVARVLDPLSPLATTNLAQHLGWVGRRAEALALLRQTLSETPGFGPAHYARWLLYQADGAGQEDRVLVAELTATLRGFGFVDVAAGLEPVAAANGYQEAARWAARELARLSDRQRVSPTLIAELFMVSDDADEALRWLQRGYAQRSPEIAWIAVEPQWHPLHEREGFQALVRALRLALVPLRS